MALAAAIHTHLLWVAVVWPLLLAAPWVRVRTSWVRHLAILPAAALVMWPGHVSLTLPQFLLGTGLAVEGQTRWILAMSVIVWLASADSSAARHHALSVERSRALFLLTVMGNIGAILSTDVVGFFVFSGIMGYSFYGLFISWADKAGRRAGRVYLILLIFADQSLFEAMLTAAMHTHDLTFTAVRQAMGSAHHAQTYVLFALIGFCLKIGLWPTHWWLSSGYRSTSRPLAVLFAAVPVATGLLGAVRWLPMGDFSSHVVGVAVQVVGVAATLYGAQRLVRSPATRAVPAWGVVAGTGILVALLGRGLMVPADWSHYGYLAQPYIAALGFAAMVLTIAADALWKTPPPPVQEVALGAPSLLKRQLLIIWAATEHWRLQGCLWLNRRRLKAVDMYQQTIERSKRDTVTGSWATAIGIFVVIGLLMAWLSR